MQYCKVTTAITVGFNDKPNQQLFTRLLTVSFNIYFSINAAES